jgi:hypothetical protein
MEPHQQRVVDELKELEVKRSKLGKFIQENKMFKTLPAAEKERLRRQFSIIMQYEEVLTERIRAFPDKKLDTKKKS